MKFNILNISLIISILLFIHMLLDYFGFIRHLKNHLYSPSHYIKHYHKLDKIHKNKIIISLTTTPEKLKKIKPVINSLLDQTVKVDLISITVPYGKQYILPNNLKDCVLLHRTGKNHGKLNSLIPVLLREGDNDTSIITVGDDKIYEKDFIENLIQMSIKHPDKVVCVGNDIDTEKGSLFKTNFFDIDFIEKSCDINKYISETKRIKIQK